MLYMKSNTEILAELDTMVYGHTLAKKVLINALSRSRLRYHQKWGYLEEDPNELIDLHNVMLIGNSGTGKTYLVECLTKICDVPLIKIDATMLAPVSAHGMTIEDVEKKIHNKIRQELNDSRKFGFSDEGIADLLVVFIDEFDKLGSRISNGWNQNTQASLLTLLENKGNFTGITFILAGAFQEMVKEDTGKVKQEMGFGVRESRTENKEKDWEQEIIKNGILPEIVGRINSIVKLDNLSKEHYMNILETIVIPKKTKQLKRFNVHDFELTLEQKETLVKKAFESGLGVRHLKKELDKLVLDKEFLYEDNLFLLEYGKTDEMGL